MSYRSQSHIAADDALMRRVAACAVAEGLREDPVAWASSHMWVLSAEPGWAAAYESAVTSGDASPGGRADVITDGMILSSVQPLLSPAE